MIIIILHCFIPFLDYRDYYSDFWPSYYPIYYEGQNTLVAMITVLGKVTTVGYYFLIPNILSFLSRAYMPSKVITTIYELRSLNSILVKPVKYN